MEINLTYEEILNYGNKIQLNQLVYDELVKVLEWSKKLEKMGVGEIILTSVDNEGLGIGFDIELVKKVIENVNLPVVIHGGAGNKKDILDLIRNTKVSGVAIASMFHYSYLRKLKKSIKSKNDNFNLSFTKFEDCSIKKFLAPSSILSSIFVLVTFGAIALTRILNFPSSIARVFVIPTTAHLLAA